MKQKLLILVTFLFVFLSFSVPSIHAADPDFNAPPTQVDFDQLNPLFIGGKKDIYKEDGISDKITNFSSPGAIASAAITFAFQIAGLILFMMIIWGGFEMLSGAATSKSKEAGQQRITAAITGFVLLFAAYWIAQILEALFGVTILG